MSLTKAYVLLSGGIDSTTCLAQALEDWPGMPVRAISIDYGQRHKKELEHARTIAHFYGASHRVLELRNIIDPTMLTDPSIPIPSKAYDELPPGISPTYVPFRNGLLLSMIAALAQASRDQSVIYFGAHAEDAANWAYPDCTPEFIGAMANAIFIGTYQNVRLATPLQWMNKADIITRATQLGVPLKLTWSCYAGGEKHCGTCPTCQARKVGFRRANVADPTEYMA